MRRMFLVLGVALLVVVSAAPVSAARKPRPPANDTISGATAVTLGQSLDFSSVGATSSASDPQACDGSGPTPGPFTETIWYAYTATDARAVFADASTFDYLAAIFVLADLGAGLQVVDCSAFPATVNFTTSPGVTYYVMIGSLPETPGGGTGIFTLAEPLVVSLTVDPEAALDAKTGLATVTGTIMCSQPAAFAEVDVRLSQAIGRFIIRGFGFAEPTCTPAPSAWSADVVADNGSFSGGRATVDASAFACADVKSTCDDDFVSTTVRLRR
jgi:hypothetical protein